MGESTREGREADDDGRVFRAAPYLKGGATTDKTTCHDGRNIHGACRVVSKTPSDYSWCLSCRTENSL